jgi:hypothetical protein
LLPVSRYTNHIISMNLKAQLFKISLSVLLTFICMTAFGKDKYLPGYIIQLNGDTIKGFIAYRNWNANPERIFFKRDLSFPREGYSSTEIKGFKVSDELYISAIVIIDKSEISNEGLEESEEGILIIDTVFLQTMIQGTKSLYYYIEKNIKAQFYIKQDTAYELLLYKKYREQQVIRGTSLALDEGFLMKQKYENAVIEKKPFLNQLAIYLQDCPDIQSTFNTTAYTKESLEKLFHNYYECINSKMAFQKKTEMTLIETGVLSGLSVTTVTFSGDYNKHLVNADIEPSVNYSGGLFISFIFPRNFRRWSFNSELLYAAYKINPTYTEYINENEYTIHTSTINLSYVKINPMIRYSYPVGNSFLFLNAGISLGFTVSKTNYYKKESKLYNQVTVDESVAVRGMRNREAAINIGLGSRYKKFSVELRYENGGGMSGAGNLKAVSNRYYCLFGYRF